MRPDTRHGRACPAHPRLWRRKREKAWMPGTRPGMTTSLLRLCGERARRNDEPGSHVPPDAEPGRSRLVFGGEQFGRCVGSGARAAVAQDSFGEVLAFHGAA